MRPKEIQEKLHIDAGRIKLFKKEGIFAPENPPLGNRSTDYTSVDLENLRKLVVLTKSGLTCSDIKKLQADECTLAEVIDARRNHIQAEMSRKQNALLMLSELQADNVGFDTFDAVHYWDVITVKESHGEEFITTEDMYDYHAVPLTRYIKCPYCNKEHTVDLEDYVYDQSSAECGMGSDIVYSFNSEESHECPGCGQLIQIEGWIREYPEGAYDSEDVNVTKYEVLHDDK